LKVAVVDYDAGNTLSVTRALEKVGARVDLTPDPERVLAADAVVLPGVGAFGECMRKLRERGMDEACLETYHSGKPFLGVCVALQVFFEGSEETPGVKGLGILPGRLGGEAFYFVHSYYPEPEEARDLLGVSDYGGTFCAAAGRENLAAVQFHPEKSSLAGLKLYENFLLWARTL
jgi:glutamine amidotransferase